MTAKQGEISVLLSLILVCILSLFLGLVESARTTGARLYLEMAANSSMDSVMSQYNRNLWDMYHLLFLETESDAAVEESFASYLSFYLEQENLYPMRIKEVNVKGAERMTDHYGRTLEQEILSYVVYQFPDIADSLAGVEQILEEVQGVEQEKPDWETARECIDVVTDTSEEEDTEIDWEKIRLLDRLEEIFRGDLLDMILEEDVAVSKKSVRLRGIPSTERDKGLKLEESNVVEQFMINEYCLLSFDSFRNRCERKVVPDQQALQYEQEYLLCGKESDRKNLIETVEKLLTLRGALNLSYLLQNPSCRREVDLFTMTISGGNVYIQTFLSFFVLSLWAFGEAVWDIKLLMRGDCVPFVKVKSEWKLELEEFLDLRFLDKPPKAETEGGRYQDYLRILFFLLNRIERNFRIMDVIEWNIQSVQEDFLAKDCISNVKIQVTVEERHLFLKQGMYSRATEVSGSY